MLGDCFGMQLNCPGGGGRTWEDSWHNPYTAKRCERVDEEDEDKDEGESEEEGGDGSEDLEG